MSPMAAGGQPEAPATGDRVLIASCLRGEQPAWDALLEKYKRLIWSIPIRQGFSEQDASDIFQTACLQLYSELPRLRNHDALKSWLIQVTMHACSKWRRARSREGPALEDGQFDIAAPAGSLEEDARREQIVREAIAAQKPRCRNLIRMLFFEDPPRPYQQVAAELGLATGSIGFVRGRCLKNLEKTLREMGL